MRWLVGSYWVMLRHTHRHPVNRALHIAGMPFYILGIALMIKSDIGPGALLLVAAVVIFTVGHKIEGNLRSITPVLAYLLISRNVRRYIAANRIHIQAR
jgi:hypothetical protein